MGMELIATKPWELTDPERVAKFRKGVPGKTADIWAEKPNLDACWRGDHRDWHIEDGRHYQEQLYCRFWQKFVNPSGFTCSFCVEHQWPAIEKWRIHILPALIADKGKEAAGDALVDAVARGRLTEAEAIQLGKEFGL